MANTDEIQRRLKELDDQKNKDSEKAKHHIQLGRARRSASELRNINRTLERDLETEKAKVEFLLAITEADEVVPSKQIILKAPKRQKKLPRGCYVMPASDWHMGERVRPETVQWRNEYSPEIASERAEKFFKSHLTMLDVNRRGWDIQEAIFWLGGDLMTGYIHEEYEEENYLSPIEEALFVYDEVVKGIEFLLARSDLATIYVPTSCGNHGRTGKKIRISTYAKNNFEYMVYRMLERRYVGEKRIKFQVGVGYNNVVDVYGFKIRFHHGDGFNFGGGVGGLTIPANKWIMRSNQQQEPPQLDQFGHYHQLMAPKYFVCNSSLIGWNAYAEHKGLEFEEPQQCCYVIDSERLVRSAFSPIFVTPSGGKR